MSLIYNYTNSVLSLDYKTTISHLNITLELNLFKLLEFLKKKR